MSKQFFDLSRKIYLASCLYDCIEDSNIKAIEKLLVNNRADPNIIIPGRGISPFHLAIGNDTDETAEQITQLLLNHGANPNVRSDDGLTPVHVAAAWGRLNVLHILLKHGGELTLRDEDGKLPVDYAIEQQHSAIISYLVNVNDSSNENDELKKKQYDFVLDKIIINNGLLMAEYGASIDESKCYNICNAVKPVCQTSVNSYVEDWCYKHANIGKDYTDILSTNNLSADLRLSNKDNLSFNIKNPYETRSVKNNLNACVQCYDADKSNLKKNNEYSPDKIYSYLVPHNINFTNESIISSEESCLVMKHNVRESGILTIYDSSGINDTEDSGNSCNIIYSSHESNQGTSEYITCDEEQSVNTHEKNIFECNETISSVVNVTNDMTNLSVSADLNNKYATNIPCQISEQFESDNESFISCIAEEYKYIDEEEGIVLIEKRILVHPKLDDNKSGISTSTHTSSKLSSLPPVMDYDTDTLRKELTLLGEPPGPLTKTTKRVYLKKLIRLKKHPTITRQLDNNFDRVYSVELEKTFLNPNWSNDLQSYKALEDSVVKQFSNPEPAKRWREGLVKASFTYLLLDPRVTNNLPGRAEKLSSNEMWKTFLSSIFYVGKGKRSRPYSHLYEAVSYWNKKKSTVGQKKIDYILNIWRQEYGVVCLHVFQNVIPVEAYTREAAMINAIKLQNLCNSKAGDFYGICATWPERHKRLLGVYLLYRAMLIFLNEGERQLRPDDIGK